MAKISVIIPCYNAEKYIVQCVESLKKQSFTDFTIIFVDDASTDDTVNRIQEIRAKESLDIVLLTNSQNSGPAVSRNKGIEYSTSEYITFCDCDDWYEPDYLEKMIKMLTQECVDIALCGYKVVDENSKVQYRPMVDVDVTMNSTEALRLEADSLCMLMVKASIMKETLLPDLRNGEDSAVVPLLIAKANGCAVTKDCLYNYFRRQGSASQKPTMKVVESLRKSFAHTENEFPVGMKAELEYLGMKNMLYSTLISLFSFSFDIKKADEILNDFERIYPSWIENPYFKYMSSYKRIVLRLANRRLYPIIKLVACVRMIITH